MFRSSARLRAAISLTWATLLVAFTAVTPSPASAAPAQVPCSAIAGGKYNCQWYRPGDGISGGAIVVAGGKRVGYLHKGTNWIICQQQGAAVHSPEGYENVWYGWTEADDQAWGWASALDASGGDNNGSFSNAPNCNGAHGAAPSVSGLWSTDPPAAPAGSAPPAPSPAHTPTPAPDSPQYTAALNSGFGSLSKFQSRAIFNAGAVTGDDGVIVVRFFIPHDTAAGRSLLGDNRGFDSTADMSDHSRGWLVWDVGTGNVSLTMAPSTVGPLLGVFEGDRISALRLSAKDKDSDVQGTINFRTSNDAFLERTSNNGIHFKLSLLNSLTNKAPGAAWSVDVDGRIDPANDTTLGAFHHYAATRSTRPMTKPDHRSKKARRASGTAALCMNGTITGKRCKAIFKALGKAAAGGAAPATASRAAVAGRASLPAPDGGSSTTSAGAGGYITSILGNGYPAIEAYYYPRHIDTARTLFRRRVDPDKLNSITAKRIDGGGGTGALDGFSWFNCSSRADGGSDCKNALPTKDGSDLPFGPQTPLLPTSMQGHVSPDSYSTNPTDNAEAH